MAAFDFAKVKDPTFFKENVLNAHASFRTYASREEYLAGESSLALKLDGIWKFAYAKNYTSAIPGFEKTDYDCSGWDDIHVPAHIQMEGYDIPQYANIQYPWDGREEVQPGEIPQRFNPVASYIKYFELPESMQSKPVHIEFEGVESGMALWLNGSYVGYTEDSFSAHAFDLTPYLQPGVNKLAVQVFKWTSSSWCEDQDFFRFSGIFRSVWLYAIQTTLHYDPVEGLAAMPEFGVLFKIDADYDTVEWYGNGPAETYWDRQHGAKLGIYQNTVADNMAQYLVPQECGAKTAVRWAKVVDRKGRGLLFTADAAKPMFFSALPYTPHEMESAKHPYELPPVHYTVIRAIGEQMGVGGDDSWGANVHPEYIPDVTKPVEFTFTFRGI